MQNHATDLKAPLYDPPHGENAASSFHTSAPHPGSTHAPYNPVGWWHSVMGWDTHTLLRYMRYINVILALFQALTGFFGLFDLAMLNITSFLIAVYVIIFALLLLAFECRFTSMEPTIRQLFGFLFTYRGRTAFIFFVGFMNFGMRDAMAKLAGVLMCTNALLNLSVMTCHPSFRSGALRADMDPTTGYTAGEDETAQMLKANSHLAAQAGTYAFSHLSPEVATQIVRQVVVTSPQGGGSYVPPTPTS
ncbi:hypothetical protein H310_12554 [Aphanomyces invadans]|uniref:Golgi apparatus membrane protein TVP15 n=2 Tax=Aphanomyces invadans TaxID=157072 RepID=A0A024TJK2_9STRA|nr:hypothetical protein H310_12554 [Aphanomyces invadans]ETV93512.1 hypothetical protein H310_12554 [Aphanomyces invadans]|eukprot:XP_008877854.1 hypothetical protein H310_12554 [Aphanomyces invadans]